MAALLADLRRRGLLDDTLVVWGSEFGRTPLSQGVNSAGTKTKLGRDHHKDAFTMWMAGGGVRRATIHGATDDLGFSITDSPVHVHDLNATILHLLGLEHTRLTFRHQGRDYRLTDVHGELVTGILA
jgi:arylsulfatase A-like enzyme